MDKLTDTDNWENGQLGEWTIGRMDNWENGQLEEWTVYKIDKLS
jgi:hypothetical protein